MNSCPIQPLQRRLSNGVLECHRAWLVFEYRRGLRHCFRVVRAREHIFALLQRVSIVLEGVRRTGGLTWNWGQWSALAPQSFRELREVPAAEGDGCQTHRDSPPKQSGGGTGGAYHYEC